MAAIDTGAKQLHYFHNRGLYALEGEDFELCFVFTCRRATITSRRTRNSSGSMPVRASRARS